MDKVELSRRAFLQAVLLIGASFLRSTIQLPDQSSASAQPSVAADRAEIWWSSQLSITGNPGNPQVSTFSTQTPAAVARDPDQRDLFVGGHDGRVATNWRGIADIQYVPASTRRVCQLTGAYDPENLPHINNTAQWGIVGTDMGIPVEHDGKLYIFFGDVPAPGKPHHDVDPIVYTTATVPEPHGFTINAILQDTAFKPFAVHRRGTLGTNETATGAFSYDGRVYVFIITGDRNPTSFLTSSRDPAQDFDQHFMISDKEGKFWQITPWVIRNADWQGLPITSGDGLLLWGQSWNKVYLAWMPLYPGYHPPAGLKYYIGGSSWSDRQQQAMPVFSTNGVTQLSVGWIQQLQCWIMLYTRASLQAPYESIVCRVGTTPWDWSQEITLFNPVREGAFTRYMHQPGKDQLHLLPPRRRAADSGWAYAPFLLNRYTKWDAYKQVVTLYYLMSINSPYQVLLMSSQIRIHPR